MDGPKFVADPSFRVKIPDVHLGSTIGALAMLLGPFAVFGFTAVDSLRRGLVGEAMMLVPPVCITVWSAFRTIRRHLRGRGRGFVATYLQLERYDKQGTTRVAQWHEVRLVQRLERGPLFIPQWRLDAYAGDGSFLGTIAEHERDLTAFMMLRCGKLEADGSVHPTPREYVARGTVNTALGLIGSVLAALLLLSVLRLAGSGSFDNGLVLSSLFVAFFALLELAAGGIDIVRGLTRRLPKTTEEPLIQRWALARVPMRVEMEPGVWYVYRNRNEIYRKHRGECLQAVWVTAILSVAMAALILLVPLPDGKPRNTTDAAAGLPFAAMAALIALIGLPAANRAMHRFKLEGDELLVDTGKRMLRFSSQPRFRWRGGHRREKWMEKADRYYRFPYFYPIDPCYLIEEDAEESRPEQ